MMKKNTHTQTHAVGVCLSVELWRWWWWWILGGDFGVREEHGWQDWKPAIISVETVRERNKEREHQVLFIAHYIFFLS